MYVRPIHQTLKKRIAEKLKFIQVLSGPRKNRNLQTAKAEPDYRGHPVESAIGAALVNSVKGSGSDVFYWSGSNREVDFVVKDKDSLIAIEIKSGGKKGALPGMEEFAKQYHACRKLLIGAQGISIEQFLSPTASIIGA
jgi:hypothetical protein